jgi:hypothetical protein
MNRHGVLVDILHFSHTCPDHVFVLFNFGPIPSDDSRAPLIVLRLLDVNFLVPQPHPPALGRNPDTGDVTLRHVVTLADTTASGLLELIDQGVALALDWRKGYFLDEDDSRSAHPSAGGSTVPVEKLA